MLNNKANIPNRQMLRHQRRISLRLIAKSDESDGRRIEKLNDHFRLN